VKADKQATEARRFKDPNSHITKDGRLVLHGEDWDDMRFLLLTRSHGQCENVIAGQRCWRECADPHHKELRSVLRNDSLENLLAVCRPCHRELDKQQRQARKRLTLPVCP
jgi:hypothetical protein